MPNALGLRVLYNTDYFFRTTWNRKFGLFNLQMIEHSF
jgi:hypothetical protein